LLTGPKCLQIDAHWKRFPALSAVAQNSSCVLKSHLNKETEKREKKTKKIKREDGTEKGREKRGNLLYWHKEDRRASLISRMGGKYMLQSGMFFDHFD